MPKVRYHKKIFLYTLLVSAAVIMLSAGFVFTKISFNMWGIIELGIGLCLLIVCSAIAMNGSRVQSLSRKRSLAAIFANTSANVVTPAGIGGHALMIRLHMRSGLSVEQATAAITCRALAGVFVGMTIMTSVMTSSFPGLPQLSLPWQHTVAIGLVVLASFSVTVAALPSLTQRLRRFVQAFGAIACRPKRIIMLVAGSFGVLGAQVLLLDGAVRTVEGSLSPLAVLLAMLSAGAAKAMIPSPGGIGPVETALMATLTAVGLSFGAAMLAVGLYRGIGLGIPVIAGVFSLKMLRDRGLI